MSERDIIDRWGSDEFYYKELEAFHNTHERAGYIEYDNELKVPVRAVYMFKPLQVYIEHLQLIAKLQAQNDKQK